MPSTTTTPRPPHTVFSTRLVLLIAIAGAVVVLLLSVFLPTVGSDAVANPRYPVTINTAMFGEATGPEDGAIPSTRVADIHSDLPAVTQLDPDLRHALEEATGAAANNGQALHITSGWRSVQYQEQLFTDAVATYGSEDLAREFVAPADRSNHITGRAVDIGPLDAQLWLMEHGSTYGLCQIYVNERWHFELATTPGGTCPDLLADASHG
jgi:D-alanyl-D-alanine carboxypeptidase